MNDARMMSYLHIPHHLLCLMLKKRLSGVFFARAIKDGDSQ